MDLERRVIFSEYASPKIYAATFSRNVPGGNIKLHHQDHNHDLSVGMAIYGRLYFLTRFHIRLGIFEFAFPFSRYLILCDRFFKYLFDRMGAHC